MPHQAFICISSIISPIFSGSKRSQSVPERSPEGVVRQRERERDCQSLFDSVLINLQVIVMGATNRPQDLDSAIMRRMPTRFHINQPVSH